MADLAFYVAEPDESASYLQLKGVIGKWPSAMVLEHAEADRFAGELSDVEYADLVERVDMEDAPQLALLFSRIGNADTAARLHAASCSVVEQARSKRHIQVVTEDIAGHITDLHERGWRVKQCRCVEAAS